MSKLHKKMVELGDLSQHSYEDIVAACGEPKSVENWEFSDIGHGKRALWSDGRFSMGLNFKNDGTYCGIHHHRNTEPYIILAVVTVLIIAAALIVGAIMRSRSEAAETSESAAGFFNKIDTAPVAEDFYAGGMQFEILGNEI